MCARKAVGDLAQPVRTTLILAHPQMAFLVSAAASLTFDAPIAVRSRSIQIELSKPSERLSKIEKCCTYFRVSVRGEP